MGKGENLGEFEILTLAAVMRLEARAYGVAVREELAERAGREVSIGAVYATLDRLQAKGLLESRRGEATPARGGRAKTYFEITPEGRVRLEAALDQLSRMTQGLPLRTGGGGG